METGPWVKEFLLWDYIPDVSVCDELIRFHQQSDQKHPGCVFNGVDLDHKDSTDVVLSDVELMKKHAAQLKIIANKYVQKFPYCNQYAPWSIFEDVVIQHYAPPQQAYKAWHTERVNNHPQISARHLVFMTYLNDVHDGGETEWYHQEVKLSPRKGLTAIWPVDWTYTHRGVPSKTEHKYIVTGWFSYYSREQTQG
jgi:prolyl 4-hydroxylase